MYILGILGITKNKKPSCNAGYVDCGNFLREVQLIDNSNKLDLNIRVFIKENGGNVQ